MKDKGNVIKYYIDESGNTGDLIMTEDNLNFSGQEYFTLACIGFEDNKLKELEEFTKKLRKKYKIQNKELKFGKMKGIFGKKIGFILELLKYIEEDSKIFIEIVDKKYIIATNIVHCLVNPPYFQLEKDSEENKQLHLVFSQWIYTYIPNDFFINFSNISRTPSEEGLNKLFDDLIQIIEEIDSEMSSSMIGNIKESIDDYKIMKKQYAKDRKNLKNNKKYYQRNKEFLQRRKPYTYFLPLPDKNKRGELIGILPHISSFTNLHARLNFYYDNDLSFISIIHDNQAHFDEIIEHYHKTAIKENDNIDKIFENERANFSFTSITSLEFQDDKNQIGLQVADIFAGFTNKAVDYIINDEKYLTPEEYDILLQVLASHYYIQDINYVIPIEHNVGKIFEILEHRVNEIMKNVRIGIDKEQIDNYLLNRLSKVQKSKK